MYWIYFLILIPLCSILPISFGYENGVVETLQLVVLASCIVVIAYGCRLKLIEWQGNKNALCYAGVITFFLLIMREISWGRVLILRPDGSTSQYSDLGLYGQLVHPMIVILIVLALLLLYKARVWRVFKHIKLRLNYIIAMLLFMVMAKLGECHCWSLYSGDLAEELAELGAYMMLLYLLRDGFRQLRMR